MSSSHIISIEDCGSGVYTKVRKQLNKSLGGPEFWDYDKPLFSVDCESEAFDTLQDKLGAIDGIKFLPDHKVVEVVAEAEPEPEPEPEPAEAEPAPEESEPEEAEEQPAAAAAAKSSDTQATLDAFLSKYARKG